MKLYGSTTSPFVRRIRIVLASTPHEFINLEIFTVQDRELLASQNPTLKVPCLEDEGQRVFDSRIIYRYLSKKLGHEALNWEQENQLTLIDAASDSFVQLLILTRSDIDVSEDRLHFRLQKERIEAVLNTLEEELAQGGFAEWRYPEICLYSLIDWVEFRELHSLADYPELRRFREKHADRIEVTATDPRQ